MAEPDRKRDGFMKDYGLRVLRFTDTDVVKNVGGVVESIIENIRALD